MLKARREEFENSIERLTSWDGFLDALDRKKMVLTPWYAVHSAVFLICIGFKTTQYAVLLMYVGFRTLSV